MVGCIAVGKICYSNGKATYPSKEGYTPIIVMMKSHSKWWPLSPYYLRDENNIILENKWQFSKIYPSVPASTQRYSRYNNTIIWQHPAEVHMIDNQPTQEYFQWRAKGFANTYAVRYPVGYHHRHKCVGALTTDGRRLDYVGARREIYLPDYFHSVRRQELYSKLLDMLCSDINLLICDVDGPHQESSQYYHDNYDLPMDRIVDSCVDIDGYDILNLFLNDTKHSFGHGYCLAWVLYADTVQ